MASRTSSEGDRKVGETWTSDDEYQGADHWHSDLYRHEGASSIAGEASGTSEISDKDTETRIPSRNVYGQAIKKKFDVDDVETDDEYDSKFKEMNTEPSDDSQMGGDLTKEGDCADRADPHFSQYSGLEDDQILDGSYEERMMEMYKNRRKPSTDTITSGVIEYIPCDAALHHGDSATCPPDVESVLAAESDVEAENFHNLSLPEENDEGSSDWEPEGLPENSVSEDVDAVLDVEEPDNEVEGDYSGGDALREKEYEESEVFEEPECSKTKCEPHTCCFLNIGGGGDGKRDVEIINRLKKLKDAIANMREELTHARTECKKESDEVAKLVEEAAARNRAAEVEEDYRAEQSLQLVNAPVSPPVSAYATFITLGELNPPPSVFHRTYPVNIPQITIPTNVLESRLKATRQSASTNYRASLNQLEKMVQKEMATIQDSMIRLEPLNKMAAEWDSPTQIRSPSMDVVSPELLTPTGGNKLEQFTLVPPREPRDTRDIPL